MHCTLRSVMFLGMLSLLSTLNAAAGEPASLSPLSPLGCRQACYGKFAEAAWTHLPAIGVHYIFLGVPAAEEVEQVREKLAANHLKVAVLRGQADLAQESSVEELGRQAAICETLGVHYMFLSPKHEGVSKEVACERLHRVGDLAQQHGVTVTLETHRDLGTNGDEHVATMKRINHPNVRVNFDTGNISYYNHGTDAVTELKKCIDYVATVEIKDHNAEYETWNFPALGQGKVDIPAVLQLLQQHGYHGPITVELEGVRGVERNECEVKRDLAESMAYLRSLGQFD